MVTCHFHRYYKLHSNMKQKKLRQLRISLIFLNFISFFMANFLYFLTELLEISSLTVQLFCLLRFSGTAVNTASVCCPGVGQPAMCVSCCRRTRKDQQIIMEGTEWNAGTTFTPIREKWPDKKFRFPNYPSHLHSNTGKRPDKAIKELGIRSCHEGFRILQLSPQENSTRGSYFLVLSMFHGLWVGQPGNMITVASDPENRSTHDYAYLHYRGRTQ